MRQQCKLVKQWASFAHAWSLVSFQRHVVSDAVTPWRCASGPVLGSDDRRAFLQLILWRHRLRCVRMAGTRASGWSQAQPSTCHHKVSCPTFSITCVTYILPDCVRCRHGDRTPWTGDACWPNDTAVWICNLNSAQIPMYYNTQYGPVVPRLYRKGLQ